MIPDLTFPFSAIAISVSASYDLSHVVCTIALPIAFASGIFIMRMFKKRDYIN